MNPIKSANEEFQEALNLGILRPGHILSRLMFSGEYGEVVALLMLEDDRRLAILSPAPKVASQWKIGYFVVNGVVVVLVMLSIGETNSELGENVSEIWINHFDQSQGPEASLLRRLAVGTPVLLKLFDSNGRLCKDVLLEPPPLLKSFCQGVLNQMDLFEQWSEARFSECKAHLENRFSIRSLWNGGVETQLSIFLRDNEVVPTLVDLPEGPDE